MFQAIHSQLLREGATLDLHQPLIDELRAVLVHYEFLQPRLPEGAGAAGEEPEGAGGGAQGIDEPVSALPGPSSPRPPDRWIYCNCEECGLRREPS